ncbi:hypothetical protein Sipo8835_11185 [Streptomyces ipomoeae]|jgi:hypothetical protein|nr:hypothetical protein [Streptomyces ipomoeae]MDX2691951.1 hypothetical protein [Streptomyces ipomoeae]MDX2820322.1 hypothetical protein [Streptomyces ipomoeae]MDX2837446.1 hypothetical protein [Streptomyces ipomoeae]MDX2872881.1 hypothetical protein [Streptomyces ipomoeae]TQE21319.1 hypothetical protein Sipo7851_41060 [Streptomyces ipomoeae]
MSAQDPPHASGPHRPHQEQHPRKGANPLRRTSDRVEAWCSALLLLLLALGLPVASVSAGLAVYESTMRTVQAQAAERHQITARVTSAPEAAPGSAADEKQTVRVSWTGEDGRQRTGTTRVPPDKTAGSTVRIWVDREGTVQEPPMSADNATATGWLTGGLTAVAVYAGFVAGRKAVRLALNSRRYARWDAEWDLVEPTWSARFHG